MNTIKIGIIGDYNSIFRPQVMTTQALCHAAAVLGATVEEHWIPTGAARSSGSGSFKTV